MRQINSQVIQQPKQQGFAGQLLKAFIPMAVSAASNAIAPGSGQFLGGAAGAAMGGSQGAQDAAQQVDQNTDGSAPKQDEESGEVSTQNEQPQQQSEGPTSYAPEKPQVPYTPEQLAMQDAQFQQLDKMGLPVFISQNPDIIPALRGFLDQAEQRYTKQQNPY